MKMKYINIIVLLLLNYYYNSSLSYKINHKSSKLYQQLSNSRNDEIITEFKEKLNIEQKLAVFAPLSHIRYYLSIHVCMYYYYKLYCIEY